jgi:hypothetical protein
MPAADAACLTLGSPASFGCPGCGPRFTVRITGSVGAADAHVRNSTITHVRRRLIAVAVGGPWRGPSCSELAPRSRSGSHPSSRRARDPAATDVRRGGFARGAPGRRAAGRRTCRTDWILPGTVRSAGQQTTRRIRWVPVLLALHEGWTSAQPQPWAATARGCPLAGPMPWTSGCARGLYGARLPADPPMDESASKYRPDRQHCHSHEHTPSRTPCRDRGAVARRRTGAAPR